MVVKIGHFTRIFLTPFKDLLRELDRMRDDVDRHDQEIRELHAEVERLTRELRDQNQALTERQRELDTALDPVRRHITAQRGLPNERTFEHHTLAGRYVQLVEDDITQLANVSLKSERASTHARVNRFHGNERAAQTEPPDALVRREAELARELTLALLGGEGPDEARVRKLVGSALSSTDNKKRVDRALAEATALLQEMAVHGATFDKRVEAGASSKGTRLWLNCEPGVVEFVVAPAYLANGKLIADQTGKPAGPWVFTSVTGPAE